MKQLQILNKEISKCKKCPRLVEFRENVTTKKTFLCQKAWRKPVPGYGDLNAEIFILGLAPSARGGNMTGRIFTNDASGDFLVKALYLENLANIDTSKTRDDGLKLFGIYMSAAVKCVPPKNLPNKSERDNCFPYLEAEFSILKNINKVLVLGRLAHNSYLRFLKEKNIDVSKIKFVHGKHYQFENAPTLFCSYHPSPQNTNTKKLTLESFCNILKKIKIFTYKKHLTS